MNAKRTIVLIAHNLRSCHNVGSLLRTAEGLGIETVFLTGYTPYPVTETDARLPHLALKATKQISKTALGAEQSQHWVHEPRVEDVLETLKSQGYVVAALEQTPKSVPLHTYAPPDKLAILVGREVEGVEPEVVQACGLALEIPMLASKESFNVVQAAAMALYQCRWL